MKVDMKDRMKGYYKRRDKAREEKNKPSGTFPNCIGMYDECKNYNKDMPLSERSECRACPWRK